MLSVADTIIRLNNIGFVRQRRKILSDINLNVSRGDFLAITGPNGGGKTTLLRIMLKLLKPSCGTVEYESMSHPVTHLSIGYLPQKNMIDSRFPITVRQVISSGLLTSDNIDKAAISSMTDDMITLMGLQSRSDAPIGNLSGGQLQRTLLGRALISRPSVLILDEPLSYVDKTFEKQIYDIISQEASRATIILVSHEMSRIAAMANRHIIIDHTLTECSATHHSFIPTCP